MLRDLTLKYDEAAEARIQDPFTPWIKDQMTILSHFVLGEYIIWCKGYKKQKDSPVEFQLEAIRNQFQEQVNFIVAKTSKVAKEVDSQVLKSIQELQKQIDVAELKQKVPTAMNYNTESLGLNK